MHCTPVNWIKGLWLGGRTAASWPGAIRIQNLRIIGLKQLQAEAASAVRSETIDPAPNSQIGAPAGNICLQIFLFPNCKSTTILLP